MGVTQISNPGALTGEAAAYDQVYECYISAETATTISKGQVVSLNTSGKILQATTSVDEKLCIGVADEDIVAGALGRVVTKGVVVDVAAQGAITAGALVARSGTTAGSVASYTAAAVTDLGKMTGVAIAAAANSLVTIYVNKM